MTDMEGVAGVKNSPDWCLPESKYYAVGCRLLTQEVNAAVEAFFDGGATEIQVADGHGAGAIDIELLDSRVDYARGWPDGFPFGLDKSFNGIAWIGQHAKASSELAHLAHTQSFAYIDLWVNGVSIGEFGQMAMCAGELGVPCFFGAGGEAFSREAQALVPGIVTCAVKRGVTRGTGENCTLDEYRDRNTGAVHVAPERACKSIAEAAAIAIKKLKDDPPKPITLNPPYERVAIMRPSKHGEPKQIAKEAHPTSVIELMRKPMNLQPMT
jgi:D-amino peptidase